MKNVETLVLMLVGFGVIFWVLAGSRSTAHVGLPSRADLAGAMFRRRGSGVGYGLFAATDAAWTISEVPPGGATLETALILGGALALFWYSRARDLALGLLGIGGVYVAIRALQGDKSTADCYHPAADQTTLVLIFVIIAFGIGTVFSLGLFGMRALRRIAGLENRGLQKFAFYPLALCTIITVATFLVAPAGVSVLEFDTGLRILVSGLTAVVMGAAVGWGGLLMLDIIAALVLLTQMGLVVQFPGSCTGQSGVLQFVGGFLAAFFIIGVIAKKITQ